MTFSLNRSVLFIVLLLVSHVCAQNLTQSSRLVKSVLTSGGSSTVSMAYLDAQGVLKKTRIQQSIGQSGVVGLSTTALNSVQQGVLKSGTRRQMLATTTIFLELDKMMALH